MHTLHTAAPAQHAVPGSLLSHPVGSKPRPQAAASPVTRQNDCQPRLDAVGLDRSHAGCVNVEFTKSVSLSQRRPGPGPDGRLKVSDYQETRSSNKVHGPPAERTKHGHRAQLRMAPGCVCRHSWDPTAEEDTGRHGLCVQLLLASEVTKPPCPSH